MTISDIFVYNSQQYQLSVFRVIFCVKLTFKLLVINMGIWGSYLPTTAILNASSDTRDPKFSFSLNKAKLEESTKKLNAIRESLLRILRQDQNSQNRQFFLNLAEDIKLVLDRVNLIELGLNQFHKILFEGETPKMVEAKSPQSPQGDGETPPVSGDTTAIENSSDYSFQTNQNIVKLQGEYEKFYKIKKKINLIPVK
jgi:hypothetical protein